MVSSEVQRTLVKSPPELWAELSDQATLARHLGELGDIHIVRIEPENTVEWAAENTTGTVSIKPSGWGTKVTLSVTREVPEEAVPEAQALPETGRTTEQEAPPVEPPTIAGAGAAAEPASPGTEVEPKPVLEAVTEPESASEPETAKGPEAESQREPRRGFFARLFGRRRRDGMPPRSVEQRTALEQPPAAAPVDESAPEGSGRGTPDIDPEKTHYIATELVAAEEAGAEEVTAVLTAVLDRLGAAHHRPFSRS
jgi:hypothetical protein